jgi:ATP-dependent RNA helicase DHX37/DHR1
MPAPVQERYNAKARGSVAGGSTHKKRKRVKSKISEDGQVAPVVIHQDEGEEGDGRGKMSTKKRKRFDSYVVSMETWRHWALSNIIAGKEAAI